MANGRRLGATAGSSGRGCGLRLGLGFALGSGRPVRPWPRWARRPRARLGGTAAGVGVGAAPRARAPARRRRRGAARAGAVAVTAVRAPPQAPTTKPPPNTATRNATRPPMRQLDLVEDAPNRRRPPPRATPMGARDRQRRRERALRRRRGRRERHGNRRQARARRGQAQRCGPGGSVGAGKRGPPPRAAPASAGDGPAVVGVGVLRALWRPLRGRRLLVVLVLVGDRDDPRRRADRELVVVARHPRTPRPHAIGGRDRRAPSRARPSPDRRARSAPPSWSGRAQRRVDRLDLRRLLDEVVEHGEPRDQRLVVVRALARVGRRHAGQRERARGLLPRGRDRGQRARRIARRDRRGRLRDDAGVFDDARPRRRLEDGRRAS